MRRPLAALLAAGALAACGGSADGSEADDGATSTTVEALDASRIVPVNGDLAEVVFALGLGDRVVATDISATYPAEADALPEIGYQRALVAETILEHEPTLVLADGEAGPPGVLDELRSVGVEVAVVEFPKDLDGPAAKVRAVAELLGVPEDGEALADEIDAGIADAVAGVPDGGERPRVAFLYLRGDTVNLLGGEGSGVDALIAAAGGVDVGTELGLGDFTPVTEESLIEAAPDVVLVTLGGLESVGGRDGLLALPAVAGTPAGRAGRVVAFDAQLLLGLGPRTPEVLRALVAELHEGNP